jgi:uncharacterized protein YifE (UPF0438 family)
MSLPAEHTALLQRKGFPVPPGGDLDDRERSLLAKYGYWLEALAAGSLAAITPEQNHFVQVARGEAEPCSPFETAWVKYRRVAGQAPSRVGPLELVDLLGRLQKARDEAAAVREEHSTLRAGILEEVRPLLDALDAEYAGPLTASAEEVARLEAEVRKAVLAFGASFRHGNISAVLSRGRVTWDSQGLSRYMEAHPEVGELRRVGAPSVSLRYQPPPEAPSQPGGPETRR